MNQRLKTLPPAAGARRLASTDYLAALSRLELLSRLSIELAQATDERDLAEHVVAATRRLFGHPRRVELLAGTAESGEAAQVLHALCHRVDAVPAELRGTRRVADVLPYLIIPHLVAGDPESDAGALLSAPIIAGTQFFGLLVVEASPDAPDFTLADQHSLIALAAQAALVLQRVRSDKSAREERRMERDLRLAREIQRRFLPRLDGRYGAFRVAAEYHPALHVGGDFYDVVDAGGGAVLAIIGDVAGKGVSAALLMSRISSDFRRLARTTSSPSALLTQLNQAMLDHAPDDSFATAVVMRLDPRAGRAVIANAGHLAPLVRRRKGSIELIGEPSGLPVGMLPAQTYTDEVVPFETGDTVFLMTDGVVEALDRDADRLGSEWLRQLVHAGGDLGDVNRRILATIDAHIGARRPDDVTLLALELAPRCA